TGSADHGKRAEGEAGLGRRKERAGLQSWDSAGQDGQTGRSEAPDRGNLCCGFWIPGRIEENGRVLQRTELIPKFRFASFGGGKRVFLLKDGGGAGIFYAVG